jgi:archaellum component FlaC
MNQKTLPTDTITKKEVTSIFNSIHGLKEDVSELKKDVSELKKDVSGLKEDFKTYHNENMNRLDEVMAILQNIREDNIIGTYQIRELRENVDDHEKRITKIEKKSAN